MGVVRIPKGYMTTGNPKKSVETLGEALKIKANCGPCGCDDCYGYETFINAEDGELMIRYYSGTSHPFTENVYKYDDPTNGFAAVKALYLAR